MNQTDFKLKNYTTEIPANQSIREIEEILVAIGATDITKKYQSDMTVTSFCFKINGIFYQLPINVKGVYKLLFEGKRHRYGVIDSEKNRQERAYRVAWRFLRDWVHAQASIIISGQAEPAQVMLPYAYDGERTLFQAWKENQKRLPSPKEEEAVVEVVKEDEK